MHWHNTNTTIIAVHIIEYFPISYAAVKPGYLGKANQAAV